MRLIEPAAEYCRQIREYRDAFLECGDSMDGRAASTIMKNGVLIIADIWSFIDYLGNTYPSYDLSSSGHNASGGYDSGTGSSMIIPDGGNGSPSPQKTPSSPSLNSGASANDQTRIITKRQKVLPIFLILVISRI